ncbi:MAG: glucose-6-phosphate isomerase [Bacteroidales bacterium]|jgi:glucose-6-phosphate isomerase|nr:glucose-6-phosphate isomerase [Bacteroidales bacterium]
MNIEFKHSNINRRFNNAYNDLLNRLPQIHDILLDGKGFGNDLLGWIDLPLNIKDQIADIKQTATSIQQKCEAFVVIGIGGSYLGAKAVIEALSNNFNALHKDRQYPLILFAGQTLSEDYMADLLDILDQKDYCLAVISKSGTTTEPAIALRILKSHLEKKYGKEEARQRIIAITDRDKGVLKSLAIREGYKTYTVPDDVGGRFSVLTPVGLLPIAVAGFDISSIVNGACRMRDEVMQKHDSNPAWQYAAIRNALLENGKVIELMVNYKPNLTYFSEWWKQLFGESEGKENKGLFPASVNNTTDLHSLGQYIQEGMRLMFETTIHIEHSRSRVVIPQNANDEDGLQYLQDKSLTYINHRAEEGTQQAHLEGDVPQITISIDKINEESIGELIYFFEFACGLSGYLLGVNPFNQPGVEAYKRNMFRLLGK